MRKCVRGQAGHQGRPEQRCPPGSRGCSAAGAVYAAEPVGTAEKAPTCSERCSSNAEPTKTKGGWAPGKMKWFLASLYLWKGLNPSLSQDLEPRLCYEHTQDPGSECPDQREEQILGWKHRVMVELRNSALGNCWAPALLDYLAALPFSSVGFFIQNLLKYFPSEDLISQSANIQTLYHFVISYFVVLSYAYQSFAILLKDAAWVMEVKENPFSVDFNWTSSEAVGIHARRQFALFEELLLELFCFCVSIFFFQLATSQKY